MKTVNRIKPLWLALSLVFALLSIPVSGAISQQWLEREAFASVSDDEFALLELEGFENGMYDMNNKYNRFGSITNNTDKQITLTVTIHPYYFEIKHKNVRFGIKIGNKTVNFDNLGSEEHVSITLNAGESIDVEATFHQNQSGFVIASFQFAAEDITGTYTIQLDDTLKTPRRIICY